MRWRYLLVLAVLTACAVERGPLLPPGVESLEAREAAAPKVGDVFPDVTIVDDQGEAVNVRSLASEKPYTVLTLGCLT